MPTLDLKNPADNPFFVIVPAGLSAMTALSIGIILPTIVPIAKEMQVSEELSAMLIGGCFVLHNDNSQKPI